MKLGRPLMNPALDVSHQKFMKLHDGVAAETPNQVFMSEGAAAKRSTLTVMIGILPFRWLRHHDEAGPVSVTWALCFFDSCHHSRHALLVRLLTANRWRSLRLILSIMRPSYSGKIKQ